MAGDDSRRLEQIDALIAQDSGLIRRTDRRFVDLGDSAQVEEATQWWIAMTSDGGEGMVVKPAESIVIGKKGLVLPGVKCRGREYLRIIYGPEYLEPVNLDRFVASEHLFRVHECVFGVLALESEPVDPRL